MPAGVHERAAGLVALGGFGVGLFVLVCILGVEPENLGRAEVTMNLEKIVNARPKCDARIRTEPLEDNPGIALLVERELDANGNNPRSDATGWVAFAQ